MRAMALTRAVFADQGMSFARIHLEVALHRVRWMRRSAW